MDKKYIVKYKFKAFNSPEKISEFDSLTEAIDKFNKILKFYNDLDYVKIVWGNTELRVYEFD